ncbi:YihY/virulence factor BrkB family protein [Erythrobacter sp. Alg231-14]|uniref:YihY/virulence factor BrkB family protein n=1 Tax=Erythrobacter sp. Alg231-14 TaxID=1922225 RepID=UPI00307B48DD
MAINGHPPHLPPPSERRLQSLSPEARRADFLRTQSLLREDGVATDGISAAISRSDLASRIGPGTRVFEVVRRIVAGTYRDGFIHAGNLAYLSMLAIFPFFILGAALFELVGGRDRAIELVTAVLNAMPPTVARAIEPVAQDVIYARDGWLLWFGAIVALWTVSSLIESIRDILRRAYGTQASQAFWKYRLLSVGLILVAVILLMASLFAQVVIGAAQQVIIANFPQLSEAIDALRISRLFPALGLTGSLYLLFYTLTPAQYRAKSFPKWPGAVFTALWWLGVTTALPPILRSFFAYSLTYGSLAGIIIALFFFWLVGLGLVIGAELNAALTEPEAVDPDGIAPQPATDDTTEQHNT